MASEASYNKILHIYNLLKITNGLFFIIAGADKFLNMIAEWKIYVGPLVLQYIEYSPLITGVGILEIALGLLILSPLTRLGAYLSALWVAVIIVNFLVMGMYYDIAARDALIVVGLLALGMITELKDTVRVSGGRSH
ncbi:MAG: hypothetical protein M1114_04570 [Candidatus Dependentiae bacterium]|nr:hypothetical protein [Candidatus Dependentiae bacterium]